MFAGSLYKHLSKQIELKRPSDFPAFEASLCKLHKSTTMRDTSHACILCALPASGVIDGVEKASTNPFFGFTCSATPFSELNAHSCSAHWTLLMIHCCC
jgi:hypothetical protein